MKSSTIEVPAKRGSLSMQAKYRRSLGTGALREIPLGSSTAESSSEFVEKYPVQTVNEESGYKTEDDGSEAVSETSESEKRYPKHYLLILDLNGVLVAREFLGSKKPIGPQFEKGERLGAFWGWRRPGIDAFLDFVFEHFHVAIWSSVTRKNIDPLAKFALGEERYSKLMFIFDQTHCEAVSNPDDEKKPLFLKNLTEVWKAFPQQGPSDTIILDDSVKKLRNNDPNNYFIVSAWDPSVVDDDQFDHDGELFQYLEGLIYDINAKVHL